MDLGYAKTFELIPAKTVRADEAGSRADWLPLWMHLEDTRGVIDYLVAQWLPTHIIREMEESHGVINLNSVSQFLAMVHDIGKATPCFYARVAPYLPHLKSELSCRGIDSNDLKEFLYPQSSPHPLAGEAWLRRMGVPQELCTIVGSHHGKPVSMERFVDIDDQLEDAEQNYYGIHYAGSKEGELWEEARLELLNRALAQSGFASINDLPRPDRIAQLLISGILILADWLASDGRHFNLVSCNDAGNLEDYPERCKQAIKSLHIPPRWQPADFRGNTMTFFKQFGFEPNCIQRKIADVAANAKYPGLFVLEASCGTGKTEAALYAAEILANKFACGGVAFALPTQATADGAWLRVAKWARTQALDRVRTVSLAHGSSTANREYRNLMLGYDREGDREIEDGLVVLDWLSGGKRSLLSDFVVATIDQLLMSCVRLRHCMLRHIGLAGKVVIIDECHAYDAYTSVYLRRMLEWLGAYRVPTILLSATLPPSVRNKCIRAYLGNRHIESVPTAAYPCITWTDGIKVSSTRVENGETEETVSIHHCCYEEVSTLLSNRLVGGGVAGIIVNTVSKAQQFYSSLTKSLDGTEVKLFHSRFTAYDRKVREADLIHRIGKGAVRSTGLKLVIVGTQVLEQSLDIDFDILITDLAPVDLLIQRMGRLHRHQRVRPELMELPTMVVLDSDCSLDKGSEQIYGRWPLLIAKRLFHGSKINKRDTSTMVNAAYDDSSAGNDEEMRRAWDEYQKLLKRKQKKAKAFLLDGPDDWSESDTIDGLLDTDLQVNEMSAAASVRDGIRLPNAIVVMKQGEEVTLLPWVRCKQLSSDILRQQLVSLPSVFRDKQLCAAAEEWCRHNVNLLTGEIKELVGNETVLILDENLSCNLCGYKLSYHKESGLVLEGRA